ncbi:crotonobetainyl-CoA:carnitine CoA-transferase [Robbsia andropogonis]|uniref:Crotonobetainyl-CoA:carnitine CoA-transferase n=1 Tax=Robbsia andropogonis TaxID=28092 RepID=A0A0F5K0Z9_9BURK|nr:ATP-dependent acyl-CoA ligase [Robbsia andropogonis]KKB63590.1 crotonobetainyl-CoA:carnitine CoA-transferase [Robbsia andropogonis]MCP1116890.1 ATP-dependent acyl-CoA ligase [Robbsia andropogonis]MCP1126431.1 ATP-dependent acyl-CoA ligase [Robbsia andropogonis]
MRTVPALLAARCARGAEGALFSDRTDTWSASMLREAVARRAGALQAHGVTRGDRVAVLCSNRFEFLEIVLACGWLGAVAVPINTASRGAQLQHILGNSGARLLVTESSLVSAVHMLGEGACSLRSIWLIDDAVNEPLGGAKVFSIETIPMPAATDPICPATLADGDLFVILYTSGTSGLSKGVMCSHAQFYWWGTHTGGDLALRSGDVLYTCLPLFHTNALNAFFQALLFDATLIVDKRFSASRFYDALIETRATVTYVLGAMVPILLRLPEASREREHRVRVALAPGVPAQFHAIFTGRTGIGLIDIYGSTETNAVIGGALATQRAGYMGRLADAFEAQVVDACDEPVADGEAGELVLRAKQPFAFASGYFGMPEKTVEAWRNLWFHTGDRVVRESDGYFRFVDRLKDAIRRRGENISSFEVEQVLLSHPAIALVAVFAVQSELAEDEVMAAVVLREHAALKPLELVQYCEPRMPYFAVPRFIAFMDELPKTENGKIQKYKLRERGVTATTWDVETSGYRIKRT